MSKIASKTMAVIVALFLLAGVALGGTFLQAFSTANAQITSEPTIQTKVTDRVAYGESFTVAGATGYPSRSRPRAIPKSFRIAPKTR